MCGKLIYLILFVALLGLGEVRAQDLDRAAYWDGQYPFAWGGDGIPMRDAVAAAGYTILDADQLKTWMDVRIADGKASVVVFCLDIVPETVAETMDTNCTLRKYLDAGGKIVWWAGWPFYYVGHPDGSQTTWGGGGASAILGFNASSGPNDSYDDVVFTPAGISWGLTETWQSRRPTSATITTDLTVLATTSAGSAAAWAKHYVPGDKARGFVRLFDTNGQANPDDVMRVAEYLALKASNPDPPDGATGVTGPLLTWEAGTGAKFHDIYLGTNPTPGAAQYKARQPLAWNTYFHLEPLIPGATYYWRIDEVEADSTTIHTGDVWSFMVSSRKAYAPGPADGEELVEPTVTVGWTRGFGAEQHIVYFGDDFETVDNATGGVQQTAQSYTPGGLKPNWTYYWRVDEVNNADPNSPWKGHIWSFKTNADILIDDFESYTDNEQDGLAIFQTWHDGVGYSEPWPGYPGNGTGATVGYRIPPFAEQIIRYSGKQSMPFFYDNSGTGDKLLYSEAERTFDTSQDWTRHGLKALSLWFRGLPGSVGSFNYDPATDIYTMTADGQDIWNTQQPPGSGNWVEHDEFHYAYKQLSGNGSIEAQVLSVQNTNGWAKAGVMIRGTLDANSVHAMVVMTPANGVSLQRRPTVGGASEHTTLGGFQAPRWVRLTRSANDFTAEHSADGATWETVGTQNIPMAASVYIGLALTSHNNDPTVACTGTFSDVTMTGPVTGQWQSQDIGIASNDAEQLYVAVEDSAGTVKVVGHPDPNAVLTDTWQEWKIDLQDFSDAGVNLQSVKKMYIGVGDRTTHVGSAMMYTGAGDWNNSNGSGDVTVFANSAPGGSGKVFFDELSIESTAGGSVDHVRLEGKVRDILTATPIKGAKVTISGRTRYTVAPDWNYKIPLTVGLDYEVDLWKETFINDYTPNVWVVSNSPRRDFLLTPVDRSGCISSRNPVYCFESINDSRYFYTLDKYVSKFEKYQRFLDEDKPSERDALLSDPLNWTYKGITFCGTTDQVLIDEEVAKPVYRFSHTNTEAAPAYMPEGVDPGPNWTCDDEVAFYVFPVNANGQPSNSQRPPCAKPVYCFESSECRFYTIRKEEKETWSEKNNQEWTDKGVVWYAFDDIDGRIDEDCDVDLVDFALFAQYWLKTDCGDCLDCRRVDAGGDGDVDYWDLVSLCDNWLAGTLSP